jgi:hypothetical protein
MLSTNALPVIFWQSRQWQACTINGGAVNRYRIAPQAHPPSRSIPPSSFDLSADLAVVAVLCSKKTASACAKNLWKISILAGALLPNNCKQAGCFPLLPG